MPAFAAERLLPAEGGDIDLRPVDVAGRTRPWSRRRCVRPVRSAAIQSALGTRTPLVVPFQVNRMSLAGRSPPRSADLAIIGGAHVGIELQLLDHVGDPAGAEALPGEHGDRPRAEQRPHRHFERAGVGGGDDAEPVVGGQAEQRVRPVDRLAEAAPCRAPTRCERPSDAGVELVGRSSPAAWRRDRTKRSGRARAARAAAVSVTIQLSSQRARAALGRRGPPPVLAAIAASGKASSERFACCAAASG